MSDSTEDIALKLLTMEQLKNLVAYQKQLEQQLKETQEKLKIAVDALENLIDNTEHGVKQWQAAWSPNKETKAQTSIRAARQALEKIGKLK